MVAIENQTGLEHSRIGLMIQKHFGGRVILMHDKDLKMGVATTHVVKE